MTIDQMRQALVDDAAFTLEFTRDELTEMLSSYSDDEVREEYEALVFLRHGKGLDK